MTRPSHAASTVPPSFRPRSVPARRGRGAGARAGALVLSLVLALVSLAGPPSAFAQEAADALPVGRLTVTGEGRVAAVPDMGEVSLAVVRESKNAGEALAAASLAAADVLEEMRAMGVEPRDVQTVAVSLDPVYGDRTEPQGTPLIVGYRARNALSVRVRDLNLLGAVIDRSVAMGANEGGGLRLTVSNADELLVEARRLAVRDARARAEEMADAAGVGLGALVSLGEAGFMAPPPVFLEARMDMAASVPIAAGEAELTASVTAVYAIGE